ncbi:protein dachsous-like, partial [Limulus polyphemus]|uniref:Protein dachsous-like n=1 Tax=Limulus polyphemus TaxID=6850 RepID=A0ABM1BYS2_LIMPO
LTIRLSDRNSRCPKFPFSQYYGIVKENIDLDSVIVPNIQVEDAEKFQKLSYVITDDNSQETFYIDSRDPSNVSIRGRKPLDRDTMPPILHGVYTLMVTARNKRCSNSVNVKILVEDENDNSPVFKDEKFVVEIKENTRKGHVVKQLTASDGDELDDGKLRYFIVEGDPNGQFQVEENSGVLSVQVPPDREETSAFNLKVIAVDTADNTGLTSVHVVILDENDWTPTFLNETFVLNVTEGSASVGAGIQLPVVDNDDGKNGEMEVFIDEGNRDGLFRMGVEEGGAVLSVRKELDREKYAAHGFATHVVKVAARDMGKPPRTGAAQVIVIIQDINDNPPQFEKEVYYHFLSESVPVGTVFETVKAIDADSDRNTNLSYSFAPDQRNYPFELDAVLGTVNVTRQLDISQAQEYTLHIEASDGLWKGTAVLKVIVSPAEDRDPRFNKHHYNFSVLENAAGALVGQVELKPRTHRLNTETVYSIISSDTKELFSITKGGQIFTKIGLDREKRSRHTFTVMLEERRPSTKVVIATDFGNLSSSTFLTITVEDENDNAPQFQHGPLLVKLPETASPGSKVVQVSAVDSDAEGINSKVEYIITAGGRNEIRIDRITGEIYVVGILIPETFYLLNISAVDGKGLGRSTYVNISVTDVNDHRPTFVKSEYTFSILEGDYRDQRWKLGVLHAVDEDTGKNGLVDYNLLMTFDEGFPFMVDVHTGELFAKGIIDRETQFNYVFSVTALDYGEPPLNSTVKVTIEVKDVNDERPRFSTDLYLADVIENKDPGLKVTRVSAFDGDLGENGLVFYQLGEGHKNRFYIDSKDGTVWTLSKLDYEEQESYNITVIAYDHGNPSQSSSVKLLVNVIDTEDIAPEFEKSVYTLEVAESSKVGKVIFRLNAGERKFRYLLSGDQQVTETFGVDEVTGEVRILKALKNSFQSHYRLHVVAVDNSDPPKSDKTQLNIIVGTGTGVRLFSSRLYEISVQENQVAPLLVLDLNTTKEIAHKPVKYSISEQDVD